MLEAACLVEAGVKSPKNDDRVAMNSELIAEGSYSTTCDNHGLFAVCDGVGGKPFGYEAAEIATGMFSGLSGRELTTETIQEYIVKANEAVLTAQKKDSFHAEMLTTIAGVYINGDDFIVFNAGDSRVYRYRNPYIMQLSTDHSVWQEQIDLGYEPKPKQRNEITHYLGGTSYEPAIVDGKGKVFENDMFVICSDGVWGLLEFCDFENVLSSDKSLSEMCKNLVDLALKKGTDDNLSIIIVRRK